jgi:hypothetical protein
MPYNGSGVYSVPFNFVQDAANGIKILASRQDAQWADMVGAFNNCLTRDTQGKPTQAFDANNFKIINQANGSSPQDAVSFNQLAGIVAPSAAEIHSTVLASLTTGVPVNLGTTGTPAKAFDPLGEMTSGVFTASRSGYYLLSWFIRILTTGPMTWSSMPNVFPNGTGTIGVSASILDSLYPTATSQREYYGSCIAKLNATQTALVTLSAAFSAGTVQYSYSVSAAQVV